MHLRNSPNSIGRQETSHPLDGQMRVPDHARTVSEDEQFAKVNHGPAGFEAAYHSKVILKAI